MGKFLKKTFTGEGMPLMKVSGRGDVFFADDAMEIHLVNLENDALTVNGSNVLAFDSTLAWDIKKVEGASMMAGGVFNTTFTGTGTVAITSHGSPVVLNVDAPTFADIQAAIAWSSSLTTGRTTHRRRRCTHRSWLRRGLPARFQWSGVRRRPGQRGPGSGPSQPLRRESAARLSRPELALSAQDNSREPWRWLVNPVSVDRHPSRRLASLELTRSRVVPSSCRRIRRGRTAHRNVDLHSCTGHGVAGGSGDALVTGQHGASRCAVAVRRSRLSPDDHQERRRRARCVASRSASRVRILMAVEGHDPL